MKVFKILTAMVLVLSCQKAMASMGGESYLEEAPMASAWAKMDVSGEEEGPIPRESAKSLSFLTAENLHQMGLWAWGLQVLSFGGFLVTDKNLRLVCQGITGVCGLAKYAFWGGSQYQKGGLKALRSWQTLNQGLLPLLGDGLMGAMAWGASQRRLGKSQAAEISDLGGQIKSLKAKLRAEESAKNDLQRIQKELNDFKEKDLLPKQREIQRLSNELEALNKEKERWERDGIPPLREEESKEIGALKKQWEEKDKSLEEQKEKALKALEDGIQEKEKDLKSLREEKERDQKNLKEKTDRWEREIERLKEEKETVKKELQERLEKEKRELEEKREDEKEKLEGEIERLKEEKETVKKELQESFEKEKEKWENKQEAEKGKLEGEIARFKEEIGIQKENHQKKLEEKQEKWKKEIENLKKDIKKFKSKNNEKSRQGLENLKKQRDDLVEKYKVLDREVQELKEQAFPCFDMGYQLVLEAKELISQARKVTPPSQEHLEKAKKKMLQSLVAFNVADQAGNREALTQKAFVYNDLENHKESFKIYLRLLSEEIKGSAESKGSSKEIYIQNAVGQLRNLTEVEGKEKEVLELFKMLQTLADENEEVSNALNLENLDFIKFPDEGAFKEYKEGEEEGDEEYAAESEKEAEVSQETPQGN